MLIPLGIVARIGDPLYLGAWYYAAVPLAILGVAALFRPGGWFLAGGAVALSGSFLAYHYVQLVLNASRPEGLLGLGHLSSTPGALLGAVGAALLVRRQSWDGPALAFLIGLCATAAGFLSAQIVTCNAVIYCGYPLSLPFRH